MEIKERDSFFEITFDLKKPKSRYCVETVTISNYLRNYTWLVFYERKFVLKVDKKIMSEKEILFIKKKGFFVYFLCGNIYDIPLSIIKTLKALIGGMGLKGYWPIIGSRIFDY